MLTWLKQRLAKRPPVRHCRECGTVVPAGAGICPKCRSMDIEDRPPSAQQQERAGGPS